MQSHTRKLAVPAPIATPVRLYCCSARVVQWRRKAMRLQAAELREAAMRVPLVELTVRQCVMWVRTIDDLGVRYGQAFRDNEVDGETLAMLDKATLKSDIGITKLGHLNKITKGIAVLEAEGLKISDEMEAEEAEAEAVEVAREEAEAAAAEAAARAEEEAAAAETAAKAEAEAAAAAIAAAAATAVQTQVRVGCMFCAKHVLLLHDIVAVRSSERVI